MSVQQLPPPSGQVLSLVSALSNTANHELHVQAIRARDAALSSSAQSYGTLCTQLGYLLVGSDNPREILQRIPAPEMENWQHNDAASALRLREDESMWTPFGQMAGLVLKNALLRPPILPTGRSLALLPPASEQVKQMLLVCLSCQHSELRAVASSIIATTSVSPDGLQPELHIRSWQQLIPTLVNNLQQQQQLLQTNPSLPFAPIIEGSLSTIRKMMEDGPTELDQQELDALVPLLLHFLSSNDEKSKVSALQSLVACHNDSMMPSSLVLHFADYLASLSNLANDPSPTVRKWVCRSIVTLLELRTEYLQPQMEAICQFMLKSTSDITLPDVALEACEFWLAFASLDDEANTCEMLDSVAKLLPQLAPILLRNMVYLPDQQMELQVRNELDLENQSAQAERPVFHRTKNKHGGSHPADSDDDDDDDDFDDDEEGNEWTLRKCSAASLDSLASLFGAELILPALLPALQEGVSNADPWVQEASILALGAIAEGCEEEMAPHMAQLHPYLMTHLASPEALTNLPQLKSIAAWTVGRYAAWAVEQVQTGAQGHLLAQMTEVFLIRFKDLNRRVQVATCSAFGVMVEAAGDLFVPYLEHIFRGLVEAISRYQGRSLTIVFDTLGIMADFIGPAIAEAPLPSIFVPPIMRVWDGLAKNDPMDRTLLPLMEALASITQMCGMNYQPYALDTFNNSMCMIESATLLLAGDGNKPNEEDADTIICAIDLLDGLVEGVGTNFAALVSSSPRYAQSFTPMLHTLCKYDVAGVRMSALALLGDLARNSPSIIETALPQLLQEAIASIDPVNPSVCNNAVWAVGEICVRCGGNPAPLEPFAQELMQRLIGLLMGNGISNSGAMGVGFGQHGVNIPGLAENAAAAVGRLAKVNPNFVAPDLPRFLRGWCDGMAKVTDPTERHDAFEGFMKVVYVNPQAIQNASTGSVETSIASILFAIASWHIPMHIGTENEVADLLNGPEYTFQPFPQSEVELGTSLARLMIEIRNSIGEGVWSSIQKQLPVNLRRLLREAYNL